VNNEVFGTVVVMVKSCLSSLTSYRNIKLTGIAGLHK